MVKFTFTFLDVYHSPSKAIQVSQDIKIVQLGLVCIYLHCFLRADLQNGNLTSQSYFPHLITEHKDNLSTLYGPIQAV